jgi:hypothetical protein
MTGKKGKAKLVKAKERALTRFINTTQWAWGNPRG